MPSALHERVQSLLHIAADLDWAQQEQANGAVRLTAPPPWHNVTIMVPGGNKTVRDNMMRSWYRKLLRYSDPVRRTAITATVIDQLPPDIAQEFNLGIKKIIRSAPTPPEPRPPKAKPSAVTAVVEVPDPVTDADALADAMRPKAGGNRNPRTGATVETEYEPRPAPHVVTERPWLAHYAANKRGGRRYESKATVERVWSDGHIDYRCAWPGCPFTDDVPQRVSSHYARTKDHHPVEEPAYDDMLFDPSYVEPVSDREVARTKRVDRLRDRIMIALRGLDLEADDFALRLADRLTPEASTDDEHDLPPLTSEEILERVRRLVDRGEYLAARDKVVGLEEQVGKLQASLDEQTHIAERAVERWRTLKSIVSEEPDD